MATTIQITEELQHELARKKLSERETYEEVIWDLIEDTAALSEETLRELETARAEVRAGRVHSLAKVKKELGL
ncbi:hypothetical protein HY642_03920 [Candidatus Woesearchaeota archaeon]|nr:hypothetical protein [Candidatus Woesearchaeota archaeon]